MRIHKIALFFSVVALMSMAACKKKVNFTYKANCIDCKISYYDEEGNFVSREEHSGSFEQEVSVAEFSPIMIAVQSTAFKDSSSNNPIFATDLISIELSKGGEVVCADTSANGKKFQAVSCSYDWQK